MMHEGETFKNRSVDIKVVRRASNGARCVLKPKT
jgi:hypothetical protein